MITCPRCVLPDTRPGLGLRPDGTCDCGTPEAKGAIDWTARAADLETLLAEARSHAAARGAMYDCVIPVSGGKDSHWQVITMLERGLRPLCVTWRTPGRTAIGRKNLENLVSLGVDHWDITMHPRVERRFMYQSFSQVGSPAVPMHMAIFAVPLRTALLLRIPLVVWGENSALEYGGPAADRIGTDLDEAWLARYGCTFGTSARDWVGDTLSARELAPWQWPGDADLRAAGVRSIFLGAFLPWDPDEVHRVAAAHGFQARARGPRTGAWNFADIDDDFVSIHHWMKWYKFGFTRLFDNLSVDIRAGRITREEAMAVIRARGDERPDADIDLLCGYLGITRRHFFDIAERFRNPAVWTERNGVWTIPGFPIPDFDWARFGGPAPGRASGASPAGAATTSGGGIAP